MLCDIRYAPALHPSYYVVLEEEEKRRRRRRREKGEEKEEEEKEEKEERRRRSRTHGATAYASDCWSSVRLPRRTAPTTAST